ncbi:restriction endonuclease subunit S [Photobacterium phosphoreum]|uniref:restriction endonuclease subunit S n=1 Tax=Photobacterium phosphoreum TaxID=659 RepID=UPI001E50BD32|nr:restriction endonuclease subunit S [Photobacterium phosphoreum]MCD9510450.1 restriction endonuclease subunit S [Photobacterium phosphoreum]
MISKYKIEPLDTFVKQISLKNKNKENIEVYSVTNSVGFKKSSEYFNKEVFSKDLTNYKLVSRNQFAYNPSRINVGSIDYYKVDEKGLVSPLYIIFEVVGDIYPEYLLRYLKSDWGNYLIRSNTEGAVRPSLKFKGLKKVEMPVPSYIEQKKIAYLLTQVEKLIQERTKSLQTLDDLLQSTFFDFFGDPVKNERAYSSLTIDSLLSNIDSGWSPKCESVCANDEEWGVLKLGAVTSGTYIQTENKAMLPNIEPKKQHEVKVGDVLFTRKNTYDLVAATVFVYETRPKLLLPDLIFRLVIKDQNKLHPIFLWRLLSYPSLREKIQSLASGAAGSMPNISKANLKSTLIPVPDIDLQLKFVEVVNKIEVIKNSYKNGLEELKLLYQSLSNKAFKGDLDLGSVLLPDTSELQAEYIKDVNNEHLETDFLQKKIELVTKSLEKISKPLESIRNFTQPIELLTKPIDQITKHTEVFNLPKTIPDFSNDKTRQMWLIKLLEEYLIELDIRSSLSLPDFWAFAQNWIGDFEQEDGDRFLFLIDDYEIFKDWVFNEIRNGSLLQEYEKTSNNIKFKVSKK